MTNVVIASAARTAVGSFGGSFANTPAHDLGAAVLKEITARAGVDASEVSETILGQVLPAGQYRLWAEAKAYYQIGNGRFLIEAALRKVGPSGQNRADSDGDWLRDEYEVMHSGTNPNSPPTSLRH